MWTELIIKKGGKNMKEVDLAKDEEIIEEYDLSYSALFSFVKSNIGITNKRLVVTTPNTLGIIPIGKNNSTYPLNNISRVEMEHKISIKTLFIGLLIVVITLSDLKELFLLLLVGVGIMMGAIETSISIQNNAGRGIKCSISPLEKGKAKDLINELNKAIANSI